MGPTVICPECEQGKHSNCDGVGNITDANEALACRCALFGDALMIPKGPHSLSAISRARELHRMELEDLENAKLKILTGPPDEGTILAAAFPELESDEWMPNIRVKPDAVGLLKDLYDIEIQNPEGIWVPAVALPLHVFMGFHRCICGATRFGAKRYQEHYAYAHILGME